MSARRLGYAAGLTLALALVAAPPALAAAHGGFSVPVPFGLFGISVSGILKTIAKLLFNVLAGAFLPSWLRHAPGDALRWLIALPDPADPVQWPTMHHLERDTTAVAVAFLPVTFAVAAARYTASGVTGGAHHPAESVSRLLGASAGLLLFPWAFQNAVAAVNVTTSALLSFASIDHGLKRALALMFAGGIAFGVTGPVVALLVIAAILLAVGLLMIKVALLALFALLFVSGPLALALSPVPELHGAWRTWLGVLVALALIPVGWCLLFAVAGAISADITHIGTPAAIGTRLVGFFAGVLTFFLAFRWPFFLLGLIRSRGLLSGDIMGSGTAGARTQGTTATQRVRESRAALAAGAGAAGAAVSHAGAALGVPRRGLASAGVRSVNRAAASTALVLRGRQGLAASWQSLRTRAAGSRVGQSRAGRRLAEAGAVAAATPAAVRAAVAERSSPRAGRAAAEQVLTGARQGDRGSDASKPAAAGPAKSGSDATRARPAPSSPASTRAQADPRAAVASAPRAPGAAPARPGQRPAEAPANARPQPARPAKPAAADRPLEKPARNVPPAPPPARPVKPRIRPKAHREPKQPPKRPPRRRKEP